MGVGRPRAGRVPEGNCGGRRQAVTEPRTLRFVVFGESIPQGSHRAFMRPGMRHPVITESNKRLYAWRQLVAAEAQRHAGEPFAGAVSVTLAFYLPRPKRLAKRGMQLHTKRPDLDKACRAILDALTGILWHDDSQVIEIRATKSYVPPAVLPAGLMASDHGGAPRVEIEVHGM